MQGQGASSRYRLQHRCFRPWCLLAILAVSLLNITWSKFLNVRKALKFSVCMGILDSVYHIFWTRPTTLFLWCCPCFEYVFIFISFTLWLKWKVVRMLEARVETKNKPRWKGRTLMCIHSTCLNKTTSVSEASKITLTDANYNHFETNLAENNKLSVWCYR